MYPSPRTGWATPARQDKKKKKSAGKQHPLVYSLIYPPSPTPAPSPLTTPSVSNTILFVLSESPQKKTLISPKPLRHRRRGRRPWAAAKPHPSTTDA